MKECVKPVQNLRLLKCKTGVGNTLDPCKNVGKTLSEEVGHFTRMKLSEMIEQPLLCCIDTFDNSTHLVGYVEFLSIGEYVFFFFFYRLFKILLEVIRHIFGDFKNKILSSK